MILQMTRPVQGGLRQERHFENTSNHLANADTPGFKKDIVSFDKAFRAQLHTDLTQGPVRMTGNDLDFALEDEGFFVIETSRGPRYTRNGNFTVNADGFLVTQQGEAVLSGGAPLGVADGRVFADAQGNIFVDEALVGALDVVTFQNLEGLEKEGRTLFRYKGDDDDALPPPNIRVKQGALEMANVEVVEEMSHMISIHRMYEIQQKMMMTIDEIDTKAITELGRSPA
ncbi:flagellar basal-body rod protein FlgG [Desulfobotulus alkaliphilus]|uniref:Flagellar basal-body rod protein FlgG n=1 Tax=Desulfobotulus alkaliphilus TaxID=622671 RepID=A0A562RTJ5_9BACT|nr:flagellar hook-basal body protein [Desulfobotulus alkaliphilus]TWI72392.1 flagellar basal-body rod protein FlgG [Desulfobotulus alkaliphilus]